MQQELMAMKNLVKVGLLAAVAMAATPAMAALTVFQQFTGKYGLSTDGGGNIGSSLTSSSSSYTVSAWAPVGARVEAAWLYQTGYTFENRAGPYGVSLNGNALTFGSPVINNTVTELLSARADVTSLVAPIINGGTGGTYNFNITEARTGGPLFDSGTDGVALVVVYSDPSLTSNRTIAILDGFASVDGDEFTFTASRGMDPNAAGFSAELRLGIGYSCCGFQSSTVDVNGTRITNNAGNKDDGVQSSNGQLITVGGNDDPFSGLLPSYADDKERYNLVPYIGLGDTIVTVKTSNSSRDDNIFLAAFMINAEPAGLNAVVPEPATWAMMIVGFGLVGFATRRREKMARVSA
jgi:hypothetical protein